MADKQSLTRFDELIAKRSLARFHSWILAGLVILYLVTFPFLKSPILVAVPAVVAGWFYYRKGGLIASILAIIANLFLINLSLEKINWDSLFQFSNNLLFSHIFVVLASVGVGYLREFTDSYYQMNKLLHGRERSLTLLNMATKDILNGDNLNDIYYRLLTYLTNLFTADYAYLSYWSDLSRHMLPVSTTRDLNQLSSDSLEGEEANITLSALESGHALFLEDLQHSTQIANLATFKTLDLSTRSALLLPLTTKDYKFGVVTLGFNSPRRFEPEEISYFELASHQITLALRNIHQENMIEKQLREAETLANIEHALSRSERIGVDTVLQLIVDAAREVIPNTQRVVLHLLDNERKILVPRAVAGYSEAPTIRLNMLFGEGVAGQVIATGEVATITDIRSDPRFKGQTMPVTFRSLIVVPIHSNERKIGTISAHSDEIGVFGPDETNLLSALGSQVALAIENANLLETTRQNFREINTLYHFTQNLTTSLDPDQLMKDAVEFLHKVFGYYHIQIYVIDRGKAGLVARHGAGAIGNQLGEKGYTLSIGEGTIGHVAETGEPFFTNNVDDVVFYVRNPLLPHTCSEMVLPLMINNKVWGVINIQEISADPISEGQMKLMEAVTQQLAVALEKANLYTELQVSLRQEQTMRTQLVRAERLTVAGRLLASVSHELNNPLQAIQNVLFLLKDEENLSAQGRQDMEIILSETERMASMIGRLRDTYRSTQAGEFQDLEINTIVEDVFALIATYMRQRKIALEFIPDPELRVISGIPEQIRQVMLNLFMNAIEAMDPGGKLIVQTQNSRLEDDKILITVADTGAGISPEVLPEIFEPFITDKDTGTGLGLSISRDIILQHHGAIEAENRPQGGAAFKVWLPAKKHG